MKFFLILSLFISFSFTKELETKINDFFIDWDNAHNNKNIGLFDKLYSENVNYYNSNNFSKFQIIDDKIRILKKYPEFKQSSNIISKEQISNQLIKVNYEKNTFYSNKNKTFNSYLILDFTNEQIKIFEENDHKLGQKSTSIKDTTREVISLNNSYDWKDLKLEFKNSNFDASNCISAKITAQEVRNWINVVDNSCKEIIYWKNLNINTPDEALKWKKLNIHSETIGELIKLGIHNSEDIKNLSPNILRANEIKILKDLNMVSNPLIESMSRNKITIGFHLFKSTETFLEFYSTLKNHGCQKIEKIEFSESDEYNNDGYCYVFNGTLIQRLNKSEGLMSPLSPLGNNSYVFFDDSWREGTIAQGIIKGMGNLKYETVIGNQKLIRTGKVLFFTN